MTVSAEHRGRDIVLTATGELDATTLPKLRRLIGIALVDHPRRLVLDLAELRFLSARGLDFLAGTHRDAPGRLRVVAGDVVAAALDSAGLADILSVHASVEDALDP